MSAPRTAPRTLAPLLAAALLALAACGDGNDRPAPEREPRANYSSTGLLEGGPKPTATPSVVIVCLSGVRYDEAFRKEGGAEQMPRLAAFARESVSFENAASPAAWDVPAFRSVLTGVLPDQNGGLKSVGELTFDMIDSMVTLPEVLHGLGYATACMTRGGPP